MQLTFDDVPDTIPAIIFDGQEPVITWMKDGDIVEVRGYQLDSPRILISNARESSVSDLNLSRSKEGQLILSYTASTLDENDVFCCLYDRSHDAWSSPRQLTNDKERKSLSTIAMQESGLPLIAYHGSEIRYTTEEVVFESGPKMIPNIPIVSQTNLRVRECQLKHEITVLPESIQLDPLNPAPGTNVQITTTLENTGDFIEEDIHVSFIDTNNNKIIETIAIPHPLITDASHVAIVNWETPMDDFPHTIKILVESNNLDLVSKQLGSALYTMMLPDLIVGSARVERVTSEASMIIATVVNQGVVSSSNANITFHLDSSDGETLNSVLLPTLAPDMLIDIPFMINPQQILLEGMDSRDVYIVITPSTDENEFDLNNNIMDVSVFNVSSTIPEPTLPTPTPTPTSIFLSEEFEDINDFSVSPVSRYEQASIYVGELPQGIGTDGIGYIVDALPQEGILTILNSPVKVNQDLVLISVWIQANTMNCSIGLVGLNSPIDGQLGYTLVTGPDVPVGEWKKLILLYDPPNDIVQPAIQVVALESAITGVQVYIDNLEIRPLSTDNYEENTLDIDGSFDLDTTEMISNVNGDSGEALLIPDDEGGKQILLSIDESDIAANIGVFASQLQDGFPQFIKASVESQLVNGPEGTTALVMTNGYTDVGMFIYNSYLSLSSGQPHTLSIGGLFDTQNPDMPILCVVQNGGPSLQSEIIIDNLELKRLIGEM